MSIHCCHPAIHCCEILMPLAYHPITTITAKPNAVSEGLVRENASISGFSDVEEQGLITLLCRSGSTTIAEDVRSVRVL